MRRNAFLNSAAPIYNRRDTLGIGMTDPLLGKGNRLERRRFKMGGGASGVNSAQGQQYTAKDDMAAQQAIFALAVPQIQQIPSTTYAGGGTTLFGQQATVQLNPVGLNTKLTIEVVGTINIAAAETLNLTPVGLANVLSNIQLTDLSNYTRVNTTGWHLHFLATLRRNSLYGAAYANDYSGSMGSNFQVNSGPATVDAGTGAKTFRMIYEIPLAYHERSDLRGAIYANVTNATWRLGYTINPAFVAAANAASASQSVYQSSTNGDLGVLTNVTVSVYQHYYNQLPMNGSQPMIPLIALGWNYLLNCPTQQGMAVGTDFPTNYANYRTFLSTLAMFDNGGTLNSGSDINYWGISVANLTFIEKYDPFISAMRTRNLIGNDLPPGCYAFNHRPWPIRTNQFGNTQLVLNASTVNAGAVLYTAYEALAMQNQAIMGGALPASA